jgi:hypothetical protein
VVSQYLFICLHANTSSTFKAGALYVTGAFAITIGSTTAYDCWVVKATVYTFWALFLRSNCNLKLVRQSVLRRMCPVRFASEADS